MGMRPALVLLVLAGCTGGQTGEITELSLCERVVERVPLADLPADTREALDRAIARHETALAWSDGPTTTAVVDPELETDTADRVGPHPCQPIVRVPVAIQVSTADGRIDLVVRGLADVAGDVVTMQGGAHVTSLNGRDQLEAETEVWLWIEPTTEGLSGELTLDGLPAAAF